MVSVGAPAGSISNGASGSFVSADFSKCCYYTGKIQRKTLTLVLFLFFKKGASCGLCHSLSRWIHLLLAQWLRISCQLLKTKIQKKPELFFFFWLCQAWNNVNSWLGDERGFSRIWQVTISAWLGCILTWWGNPLCRSGLLSAACPQFDLLCIIMTSAF